MSGRGVRIDADLVDDLIAAQFPRLAGLPIDPVTSGTEYALFRIGADMVVRLPRAPAAIAGLVREHRWLPSLARCLPVAVPVPLGVGMPDGRFPWPWVIYSWLEGTHPSPGALADAPGMIALLKALRRLRTAGAPRAGRAGGLASCGAATRAAIAALPDGYDRAALSDAWQDVVQAPEWSGEPVWLHSDLLPWNLLTETGRLVAVIDWAGAGVGDPACDLPVAWFALTAAAREELRRALRVDDATWARGRGWALHLALVQLSQLGDTSARIATAARHALAELL